MSLESAVDAFESARPRRHPRQPREAGQLQSAIWPSSPPHERWWIPLQIVDTRWASAQ